MKKISKCKYCNSTELESDDVRGVIYCIKCGKVIEDNAIAKDVTFHNSRVQGTFVDERSNTFIGPSKQIIFILIENKFLTDPEALKKAKIHKLLTDYGFRLNMKAEDINSAKRVYTLAQEHNFIQGRRSILVAGAALYIICRKSKFPHMLIDIAECLNVSLYSLAACYIKLVKLLQWSDQIPPIDPSLYIHKYCSKLDFGEKYKDVANTALKCLQSFRKDWITQGRRPAGLCGAAIKIAASLHGFNRTNKQIIDVVKVCEETVKKRIDEFKATPVACLTQGDFEAIDFEKDSRPSMDPTSFKTRKDLFGIEMKKELKELTGNPDILHKELKNTEIEMENELKAKNQEQASGISQSNISVEKSQEEEVKESQLVLIIPPEEIKIRESSNALLVRKGEELSDFEEDEIATYILSEKEKNLKAAIWEMQNKEWCEKQEGKKRPIKEKKHKEEKKEGKNYKIIINRN